MAGIHPIISTWQSVKWIMVWYCVFQKKQLCPSLSCMIATFWQPTSFSFSPELSPDVEQKSTWAVDGAGELMCWWDKRPTHTGHLFWQAKGEQALLPRVHQSWPATCLDFAALCDFHSVPWGQHWPWLMKPGIPVLPSALQWMKKGSPLFQFSTSFVLLYQSRKVLLVSLLTTFHQVHLSRQLNASGNDSSGTVCYLLLLNFFTQGKCKVCTFLGRNWEAYNCFFRIMFCLCILKISYFPFLFYMNDN